MSEIIRKIGVILLVVLLLLISGVFLFLLYRRREEPEGERIVIAVPYSEWVSEYETNYYTRWLEKKTGYDITFVYLDEGYERESLNTMLASKNASVDAVFLPRNQEILSEKAYREYIQKGLLTAPEDCLPPGNNLDGILSEYRETDFSGLLGEDGRLYCFPSVDMARMGQNTQILWINIDWLKKLELTIPRTTEELRTVLRAFREKDPNGNGIADELPLIGCVAETSLQSYLFLLNAFTYYDAGRLSLYLEDGRVVRGAAREAFRQGLSYCASLYDEGLLVPDCLNYTKKQLMELVNDPADTVGAFTSHSIADVVYTNNPGILAHFVQLAPLSSEGLERGYAVRKDFVPDIGGLLPANAVHKEAAARIMDVMLSEEASLIALYGEEGVDWRFSQDGELSTYGTRARVTTIRYLKRERQDKNFAGAGPFFATARDLDGVTWNGDHSMTEYIDARAVKNYEEYYYPVTEDGQRQISELLAGMPSNARRTVSEYLEREILRFITGERDIKEDADWRKFCTEYGRLAGQ